MSFDDPPTLGKSSKKGEALNPWKLGESETFSSFCSWKRRIIYNAESSTKFSPFLESKSSWLHKNTETPHRGFKDIKEGTVLILSAADQCTNLNRFLDIIAEYVPTFLANEISEECKSLNEIWQTIRAYYGFEQCESSFMSFNDIQLEDGENPERLYHRIRSHFLALRC